MAHQTVFSHISAAVPAEQAKDTPPVPFRFTIEQYHQAAEAGVFEGRRVELIHGEIVAMSPMDFLHAAIITALEVCFSSLLSGRKVLYWSQRPVPMTDESEPEPDFALLDPSTLKAGRKPLGSEILLAVEVAHTSLAYDRNVKLPLYARSGVREVWIVNLAREVVEVYRDPVAEEERYATSFTAGRGETVAALSFPEVAVPVGEVFGPVTKAEE